MIVSRHQDFLLRQIHAFAAGILAALGKRDASGEEEELEALEGDTETWLGLPVDELVRMELDALMDLITERGSEDPARLLLLGLVLARRWQASRESDPNESLRWKACGLLSRALDAKPSLLTADVAEVLGALTGMQ